MIKGKQRGRQFESKVRKFLQNEGWFIYTKGVSTPGPDILALKDCVVLLLELKTFQQKQDKEVIELGGMLYEHLAKDYWPKLQNANMKKVLFGALIEIRSKRKLWYVGYVLEDKKQFKTKFIINSFSSLREWFNYLLNNTKCGDENGC